MASNRALTGVMERESTQPSLTDLLKVLAGRKRFVATMALMGAGLAAVATLVGEPSYVSVSSFTTEGRGVDGSGLAGLAERFGLTQGQSSESLDFYLHLLRSPTLLRKVATAELTGPDGRPTTYMALVTSADDAAEERITEAVNELRGAISASTNAAARLVTVELTASSPELSRALHEIVLNQVNEFNLETRQLTAAAERRFLEERSGEAASQLEMAEEQLKTFLERNRDFDRSPQLSFEAARLQRQVDHQQAVYSALVMSLEEARLAEVKTTPVITVVDEPANWTYRQDRPLLAVLAGSVLGASLAAAGILGRIALRRSE